MTIIVIHTDDVDAVTTSMTSVLKIADLFDKEWGIAMTDPNKQLGVKRTKLDYFSTKSMLLLYTIPN